MRILFDHGTPRGLARSFQGHTVEEAKVLGWDTLSNGELLTAAEKAGFEVLLTTDKKLPYQQNLTDRKIAVVVLGTATDRAYGSNGRRRSECREARNAYLRGNTGDVNHFAEPTGEDGD